MTISIQRFLVLSCLFAFVFGCARKAVTESYRVVSHDSGTGVWIIIYDGTQNGVHVKKRITAICNFYLWGDHEAVDGPQACSLRVGDVLVPNPSPGEGKEQEYFDVWIMPSQTLAISTGAKPDRVEQQFKIVNEEVID